MRRSLLVIGLAALALGSAACGNPIISENELPGTTDWEIAAGNLVTGTAWSSLEPGLTVRSNAEIEGYASATSVNVGETIDLFVNSAEPYTIRTFRLGWYGGLGGRDMGRLIVNLEGTPQPGCRYFSTTNKVECRWTRPTTLEIPHDWVSGVYLAKLTASQSGKQSYIVFVVRDDARDAGFLFQASVTTYAAYNIWGGFSLYPHRNGDRPKATHVSFDRPYDQGFATEGHEGAGELFRWEINMLRFMERSGYDVTYATNVDVHRDPDLLLNRKAFLSVGHDEYWSEEMRDNVESALDQCVSLGFFSANTAYWRTRFEPNSDGARLRTVVTYKTDACNTDPTTTTWRDDCGGVIESRPEDALIGVMWDEPNFVDNDLIVENSDHWIYRGTGLSGGDRLYGLVGYEADRLWNDAPPGTVTLATSPMCPACVEGGRVCSEVVGTTCSCPSGATESNMTVYEAGNRALVFAAGTIQWSWGLDDYESPNDESPHCSRVQPAAQRMTRNVLARMLTARCIPPGLR